MAGSGNLVRGVTVRRIGDGGVEGEPVSAGIAISRSPRSRVIGNDVSNDVKAFQSDGVDVLDSPGSVVARNRLVRNSWNGLVLIGSANSRVTNNVLDGNRNNGVEVNGASDSVLVAANRARGNATDRHRGGLRPSRARRPQPRGRRTRSASCSSTSTTA